MAYQLQVCEVEVYAKQGEPYRSSVKEHIGNKFAKNDNMNKWK